MGLDTLWIIHKSLWAAPWANTMNQAHQGKAKVLGTVLLAAHQTSKGWFLGLGIPINSRKIMVASQHLELQPHISYQNFKHLGLNNLGNGGYWYGQFWSWLNLHGLGNFYRKSTNPMAAKFQDEEIGTPPKVWVNLENFYYQIAKFWDYIIGTRNQGFTIHSCPLHKIELINCQNNFKLSQKLLSFKVSQSRSLIEFFYRFYGFFYQA